MITASTMARDLALKYKDLCLELAGKEKNNTRKNELSIMAQNLGKVPWEPRDDILGSRAGAVDQPHACDDR